MQRLWCRQLKDDTWSRTRRHCNTSPVCAGSESRSTGRVWHCPCYSAQTYAVATCPLLRVRCVTTLPHSQTTTTTTTVTHTVPSFILILQPCSGPCCLFAHSTHSFTFLSLSRYTSIHSVTHGSPSEMLSSVSSILVAVFVVLSSLGLVRCDYQPSTCEVSSVMQLITNSAPWPARQEAGGFVLKNPFTFTAKGATSSVTWPAGTIAFFGGQAAFNDGQSAAHVADHTSAAQQLLIPYTHLLRDHPSHLLFPSLLLCVLPSVDIERQCC